MPIDKKIRELEEATIYNEDLGLFDVSPIAHERLRKIADFLEKHTANTAKKIRKVKK